MMGFPSSISKSLILKGTLVYCGVSGVGIGSWECHEHVDPTVNNYLSRNRKLIDSSVLKTPMPAGEGERLKVFLEKNIGCFYRYFGEDIESSSIGLNYSQSQGGGGSIVNSIYPKESVKTGCAIIQSEVDSNFRMEVVLIGEKKAKICYIFLENSTLNLYFWVLTKENNNKWSVSNTELDKMSRWSITNIKDLTFKYTTIENSSNQTSKSGVHDLMSSSTFNLPTPSGGASEKIMDLNYQQNATQKLELSLLGTWVKRDEYCEKVKDKRISSLSEKSKIEEWCSSRP